MVLQHEEHEVIYRSGPSAPITFPPTQLLRLCVNEGVMESRLPGVNV